jgi:2-oxoglutarate ferredoxin oxidoreductase subunit alpha
VALYGNDIATFPDYPAEIRAPAGTLPGVSGFQLHFSSDDINTPGDAIDVLIAMNPAALRVNIADLKANGILIVNSDSFTENDLRKAQMTVNPLEDHSLDKFRLFPVELERLTRRALEHLGLDAKSMDRCKNFFALGMCYWLYNRSMESTVRWINDKFSKKPLLVEANQLAMKAGYSYCEATEAFQISYEIPPAQLTPGLYRNMSGNQALALGFVTASQKSGLTLFQGSYPITPASDILHELSQYKDFGVMTFQAEDEIAAITSSIGAAYAGALALTTTSGPGMALKTEALGLAVAIVNSASHRQRATRRTFHRFAHQDRTSRFAAGHVRPQLRSSHSHNRGVHSGRLLLGRHRGLPHRGKIYGPGNPAFRRLPRQRRRTVARARTQRHPGHSGKFRKKSRRL